MGRPKQPTVFKPKKLPSQDRSRETFEAIVEACTGLLSELGYAKTTTNHIAERAGVNIASLYEYFPGKDAVVAQVADRLVKRVLGRLARGAANVLAGEEDGAIARWIELIHDVVSRERELVAVFFYQVPYTNQLDAVQAVGDRLLALSQEIRSKAGSYVNPEFNDATLHLVINLVSSTILQVVLHPPRDVTRRQLLDELAMRVEQLIRG